MGAFLPENHNDVDGVGNAVPWRRRGFLDAAKQMECIIMNVVNLDTSASDFSLQFCHARQCCYARHRRITRIIKYTVIAMTLVGLTSTSSHGLVLKSLGACPRAECVARFPVSSEQFLREVRCRVGLSSMNGAACLCRGQRGYVEVIRQCRITH
jgi:hypothetical protein